MAGNEQYIFPVQLRLVNNEDMVGPIDGINVTYKTVHTYIPGTIQIYLNGLRLTEGAGNDYVEISFDTIQMNYAPLSGDVLIADYIRKDSCC